MNRKIVCLTPIKNEAWVLERFLTCASLWADHIILADQSSTDGSREIASRFPKVKIIANEATTYNEGERQELLVRAAREILGPKVLVALDADEVLSANILHSPEWKTAVQAPPGTVLEFPFVQVSRRRNEFCHHSADDQGLWFPFGYVDDGASLTHNGFHGCRLPTGNFRRRIRMNDIVVLHYCYTNSQRFESKMRWYRCYERVTYSDKSTLQISERYAVEEILINKLPMPASWMGEYLTRNIDMTSIEIEEINWWDWEVLRMFERYGTTRFRSLDVWRFDWEGVRLRGFELSVQGLPKSVIRIPSSFRHRLGRGLFRRLAPGRRRLLPLLLGFLLKDKHFPAEEIKTDPILYSNLEKKIKEKRTSRK